ncbi:MAG: hypothetical protein HQ567_02725 [Candidatus Nealsonbacteria bacterium]|nr:hypothetical protein [Candidatus Nealsonbacteria bacterium]
MRRVLLTLAVLAIVGLAAETASAWHGPNQRGGPQAYGGYGNYGTNYYPYRPPTSQAYMYPGHYGGYSSQQVQSFPASVARIMAAHSRYRYQAHPRSFYNEPPPGYYRRGW